jgi:hypothetical protein
MKQSHASRAAGLVENHHQRRRDSMAQFMLLLLSLADFVS